MPQQKHVLQRTADVFCDLFEPNQIVPRKYAAFLFPVHQEQPSHRMVLLVKRDRNEIPDPKFLLRRPGYPWQDLQRLSAAPVPPESRAAAIQYIPAERSVQIIQQKAIRTHQRQVFRRQPLTLPRLQLPKKNPLQVRVTVAQQRSLGAKRGAQFLEQQPQRLRQAQIYVHRLRKPAEELLLRGEPPVSLSQERNSSRSQ